MADDLFEDTFNLEDAIYEKAYKEGYADGITAGKVEGRTFGMAKGFDKFVESGRLFSKAVVLGQRLPSSSSSSSSSPASSSTITTKAAPSTPLPRVAANPRLEKNVVALYDLMEPETLSTANSDEAVNDFDDRFKRAQGKAKIIDRILGEKGKGAAEQSL
ncbi:hypothetical protein TD95_001046 [Thielaviopsis punctulata]|uniref:Essential protein Yae1 N-terminal domain-containing protein n=1 Tax=Thielaviopsis punctulata TaxID=72032 RepID=A0A0F4ZAR9_9PEZI|nr:hypothetical protein TD95_001046 [Thielaviopsis punctulata]